VKRLWYWVHRLFGCARWQMGYTAAMGGGWTHYKFSYGYAKRQATTDYHYNGRIRYTPDGESNDTTFHEEGRP